MLMPHWFFKFPHDFFGVQGRPIIRHAIKQPDDEAVIELYLRKLTFVVLPSTPFHYQSCKQILVSSAATV